MSAFVISQQSFFIYLSFLSKTYIIHFFPHFSYMWHLSWPAVPCMIMVFLLVVFILASYLKLRWFLTSFIFKTCTYHLLCCLLIYLPHLRVLQHCNDLELNNVHSKLNCNSLSCFGEETCFFVFVILCKSAYILIRQHCTSFHLFCKKKCASTLIVWIFFNHVTCM